MKDRFDINKVLKGYKMVTNSGDDFNPTYIHLDKNPPIMGIIHGMPFHFNIFGKCVDREEIKKTVQLKVRAPSFN